VPQPTIDKMWLAIGRSSVCEKIPPGYESTGVVVPYASNLLVASMPQAKGPFCIISALSF